MKILFTGGGTAGHVKVNSILIPLAAEKGWECVYIGSHKGAEKSIIEKQSIASYYSIATGKLRRYFSLENFIDIFRVLLGILQAYTILKKEQPHLVFSGGGFVSVPVVLAAALRKIPILIRETDCSMGLANRICAKFAKKIFLTFPEAIIEKHQEKLVDSGLIISPELLKKSEQRISFPNSNPVLLIMGGSLGSSSINQSIYSIIPELTKKFNIIHLCGNKNTKQAPNVQASYRAYQYIDNMAPLYEAADFVLTRCGSNAISECLALGKATICVPLSTANSRGEQIQNALFAEKHGTAVILSDQTLCAQSLFDAIESLKKQSPKNSQILTKEKLRENCQKIINSIESTVWQDIEKQLFYGNFYPINWQSLTTEERLIYAEMLKTADFS